MAVKPWAAQEGEKPRRCVLCGNKRAFGLEHTSTREMLCLACVSSCNEIALLASDRMDAVMATMEEMGEQAKKLSRGDDVPRA